MLLYSILDSERFRASALASFNQPGNFHMQGGTALDYKANGGYMSSFPNQNLNTESLSASDNIDDRIMKNLQFEKMSPGMMGYNTGGIVEPMAPDFNSGF